MTFKSFALAGAATFALASPALAQTAPVLSAKPVPAAQLVRQVDIPYQRFTLPNGLRVLVHTDRKAPIVAVSVWYDVGAKHEPKGSTGFAHLFEHLMFNGSENAPDDFFEPLKQVGATDFNGTTNLDRTNYFETVPTAALERALFLESDRMGYLLGAITQAKLDEQRGVVQNEKRQGDNQPYGLVRYKITEGLFPPDHPYGHDTIGSMADLDAASLDTVKNWFRDNYGPNNAVLVLAGDVDVATARRLVTKYFGAIARGKKVNTRPAPIPTLAAPKLETIKDRVAATLITRNWAIPGGAEADATALDVAASVLGGLASSRLDNALVKGDKTAVNVSAFAGGGSQIGSFRIQAVVRPGADPAAVNARIDQIMADFLKNGPTADEVSRVVTTRAAGTIQGLESVGGFGGKAVALAQGELFYNDPEFYKKRLALLAAQTPATVQTAANKWLTRPTYQLTVEKGEREKYEEAKGVAAATGPKPDVTTPFKGTRGALPPVGAITGLTFPAVERTRLKNGIEVVYAQRNAVPVTQVALSFDAGVAADVPGKLGTQVLTLSMLDEGTKRFNSIQLAEAKERLGASIGTGSSNDRTVVSLDVPSANLSPALDLFADVTRMPAFDEAELQRVKQQQLAGIAQELTNPQGLIGRVVPRLVYGEAHPYAKAQGGGDPRAVAALTRADLLAFQQAWLRPDKAKFFVVSDRPLAEVKAALDAEFGDWTATGTPGVKAFTAPRPAAPKIVLIDRPDSPQSVVVGAVPTALKGTQDILPITTANDALGGGFLSRINMDLREKRGWSYGARGGFQTAAEAAPYVISAPVQADKTGPSLTAARDVVGAFFGAEPMTQVEFDRAINGAVNALPGTYETSDAVLAAMQNNDLYKRPDDYQASLTGRYRGYTLPQLRSAIGGSFDPKKTVWVVVGDAKVVRPQLDSLGLPVEVVSAASIAGAPAGAPATARN